MNDERFNMLLGLLVENALTDTEAYELAECLSNDPKRRERVRHELALWELWAQDCARERSPEAFLAAWKTRLLAEADGRRFQEAVETRLDGENARSEAGFRRGHPGWYFGWAAGAMAAALAVGLWIAAPRSEAAIVTIRGEAVCPSCVLHQGDEHLPAVRVGRGETAKVFRLEINPTVASLQSRFCGGPSPVVVKGEALESSAGQPDFAATSIEFSPPATPRAEERVLFPF